LNRVQFQISILSKLPVSQEVAQELFMRHMGSAARICSYQELTEGFFNASYRVDLADGRFCVLKVAPPPDVRVLRYEREILYTEVEVLCLVAACTTMPVPAVLFHDEQRDLLPSPCFAMQFMEGEALNKMRPSLSPEEQERIDRVCWDYLCQMNAMNGPDFGLYTPSAMRFPTWRQAYDHLWLDVLLDGEAEGVDLPLSSDGLLDLVRQHYLALGQRPPAKAGGL